MAIEFFTGFEGCASLYDARTLFSSSNSTSTTIGLILSSGFNGSKGARSSGGGGYHRSCIASKTKVVGCHHYAENHGTSVNWDNSTIRMAGPDIRLYHNNTNTLRVYRGSTLLSISDPLPLTGWHHIEMKVFSDASVGTIQVKLNGSLVINLSDINTGGQDIVSIYFSGAHGYNYKDNIFIADDFQGELYSYLLQPSSDVVSDFTPLSGTDNFSMVETDNGDTSYVASDTIGHKDLYGYEDIPEGLIPLATICQTMARKDGTGGRQLQPIVKQDAVEYNEGSEHILLEAYPSGFMASPTFNVRSLAPDGTAWTREKINAMQWGFKVTG